MGKKSKRKQERRLEKNGRFAPLVKKLQNAGKTFTATTTEEKLSDKLWVVIEPFKEYANSAGAMERLVAMGVVAWNISVLRTKGTPTPSINKILGVFGSDKNVGEDIIETLAKRKQKLYPDIHRLIIEYHLSDLGNSYHLSVASTPK